AGWLDGARRADGTLGALCLVDRPAADRLVCRVAPRRHRVVPGCLAAQPCSTGRRLSRADCRAARERRQPAPHPGRTARADRDLAPVLAERRHAQPHEPAVTTRSIAKDLAKTTASAHVPTANAAKYLRQLCKHWSHRVAV